MRLLEDLDLHLAHELDVDLLAGLVPHQVELGVLLLQLAQLGQQDLWGRSSSGRRRR